MYKIAVVGDYDSIYGFAAVGLDICPVKSREETWEKLRQLAESGYGIVYITEKAAAELGGALDEYMEMRLPAMSTLYSVLYCPLRVERAMGRVILLRSVSMSRGQR